MRQNSNIRRFDLITINTLSRRHVIQPHPIRNVAKAGNVCFSNRPFGVKRFQAVHCYGVDVACGLLLLFGIGTKALPLWDSKTRWNNLWGGLAV